MVLYPKIISSFVLRYFWLWSELFVAREGFTYDSTMLVLLRELALVKVWTLGLISKHCNTVFLAVCHLLPCCFYIFRLQTPISTIHTTLVSPSLRWTSAPIQFAIVLGVLGTQEISCIWLQGFLRETIFILHLPRIDKPKVIHLREICYCPTKLCAWRPNTSL